VAVDLHTHSDRSDGSDPPAQVVRLAVAAGLTTVALTDHDNLEGVTEAATAAATAGIGFIPGTELSVDWPTGAMHMLVYFLDDVAGPLQDRLVEIRAGREQRNREMVDALVALGIDVTYEEVAAEAGSAVVGRPHFARVLIRKGAVASMDEAFDRYLGDGRPAYRERLRLEAAEAIGLARASGGVAVIAHPHTLGVSAVDYGTAFTELAAAGLGGIEAYYAEYDRSLREHLAALAHSLGLAATGGSDYHGTFKTGLLVGTGYGDLAVPDEAVDELRARRD
jgi:3',5'-nucleoside bisphosphate phosphatase